jgi:hypothetical protein
VPPRPWGQGLVSLAGPAGAVRLRVGGGGFATHREPHGAGTLAWDRPPPPALASFTAAKTIVPAASAAVILTNAVDGAYIMACSVILVLTLCALTRRVRFPSCVLPLQLPNVATCPLRAQSEAVVFDRAAWSMMGTTIGEPGRAGRRRETTCGRRGLCHTSGATRRRNIGVGPPAACIGVIHCGKYNCRRRKCCSNADKCSRRCICHGFSSVLVHWGSRRQPARRLASTPAISSGCATLRCAARKGPSPIHWGWGWWGDAGD